MLLILGPPLLVGGVDQVQGREGMVPFPPLGDQPVLGEGPIPLDEGVAHGRHDDLLIAPRGLHLLGDPVLPWDGRQGDEIDQGPLLRGRERKRRESLKRSELYHMCINVKFFKVALKSGKSPCTIVQGHWPNFIKIG